MNAKVNLIFTDWITITAGNIKLSS